MIDLIYLFLLTLYFWVSIKVENWITIYYLGFKYDTPPMFLNNQRIYDLIRIILFLSCVALSFFTIYIPLILCLIILFFIWILSGKIGKSKAFKRYREILIDLAQHEKDEDQKLKYTEAYQKSNEELQSKVHDSIKFAKKYGI